MTPTPALPCPHCKRVLGPESWIDVRNGVCAKCRTDFEFVPFRALNFTTVRATPQAAVPASDSVCFFHAENRAESVCDSCGRLLCPVCTVPFAGQKLCPVCIAASKRSDAPHGVRERVLYDGLALALAVLPPLTLVLFFVTPLTAPVALGLTIYGWRKPGSLVRSGRVKFIVAGVAAAVQIIWWLFVLVSVWIK
jgi:hypothetical protein